VTGALRLAPALVAAAAVGVASTAAATGPASLGNAAKTVSDAFVHALVVKHDPVRAHNFTSARILELRKLSSGFVRDGVDTVVGRSRILRGCRATPSAQPSRRGDCVLYHLRGSRKVQSGQRITDADFKVWLRQEAGRWRVWAYDYSALVTTCLSTCR
jgi:hypothetical protein